MLPPVLFTLGDARRSWVDHQQCAGHRDRATTERYRHLSPTAAEDAIRVLEHRRNGAQSGDIVEMEVPAIENVNG